jgi:hypothetical protein
MYDTKRRVERFESISYPACQNPHASSQEKSSISALPLMCGIQVTFQSTSIQ